MSLKIIKLLLVILLLLDLGFFFYFRKSNFILTICFAILCLTEVIIFSLISKRSYANKFWETIGMGMYSGLIVSLFRDIVQNSFTSFLKIMYVMGFITATILIFIGVSGSDN